MRIALPLLVLAVLVGALLLWMQPVDRDTRGLAREDSTVKAEGEAAPELVQGPAPREAAVVAPTETPEPADEEKPETEVAAAQEPPIGAGDLEAKVPITIRVVDDTDAPVGEASVTIWAMRRDDEPGGHYLYRGEQPFGETNRQGVVELDHWQWVTVDGRTGEVTLKVTHPEFVTFTGDITIGPGQHVVRLERGTTVVVTGWHGAQSNVIMDLQLQVDHEAKLGSDAWEPLADGRLATTQIPPGPHWIVASHQHPELGRLSSAAERFEVGEVGWETLYLELHAPIDFVGRVDASVPRPVADGHVMLVLRSGGLRGGEPVLSQSFEAEIEPDGTFVLAGLRPGAGQIFAICRGWSSRKTLADDPLQIGVRFTEPPSAEKKRSVLEGEGDRAYILQRTEVPQVDTPYVVGMERTGILEVTVLGPDGTPVEGATVHTSPNVRVMGVGAWIHPWREWRATTGADGVARIEDLPPTRQLWFGAGATGLRMAAQDRAETPAVDVRSGEASAGEITLEAGDG
ncbi:MAG: hypothetical protein GY711_13395 [bacterium]|nr:hypothetical protein [bacterium]